MADLTQKERDALPEKHFAVPGKRALPIHDAKHVRLAWDMVDRTHGLSDEERAAARRRILARAHELGIDTSSWGKVKAMRFEAMALELPRVLNHPNRMPFQGVLTRVGVPSDGAPGGAGGKRVLLTHDAAERALPSLLGMAVNLTADLDGHAHQNKIGLITAAHIDGDALRIEGFIYAADFPRESLRIHLDQASLGFSFEAQHARIENPEADPLVVLDLVFTGAAILMKDLAAYRTTSLAAAAGLAKEKSVMDPELKAALTEIVSGAVAPLNTAITEATTRLTAMETSVAAITAANEAVAKVVAEVEPLAAKIDAAALACETAGVGADGDAGHAAQMRALAAHMRSEAAQGRKATAFAGGTRRLAASANPVEEPDIEKNPAFRQLAEKLQTATAALEAANAKAEADKRASDDKVASLETKLTDLQAAAARQTPGPERKTLSPAILGVLAKAGVQPGAEGDAGKITVAQIDAALAASNTPPSQRMGIKLAMEKSGLVLDGSRPLGG